MTAADGEAGYRLIREMNPDLILLDLSLPLLDGTEVCRKARASGITTPIVMLTARGDEADRVFGLEDGADDYVTKPFSIRELIARIRAILRQRRDWLQDRAHFDRDLRKAAEVQRRLLPQAFPPLATLDYAGSCHPASGVGGDYFDVIDLGPGKVGLVVADVCGKGVPAALLTASIHATVRSCAAPAGDRCDRLLQEVNGLLYGRIDSGRFATMFYGVYDDATRTLVYANAGHPPPVCVTSDGASRELVEAGTPLAMFPTLEPFRATIRLAAGDTLLIFSDGIVEALDAQGDEFRTDRLVHLARHAASVESLHQEIVAAVDRHSAGLPPADDITLLVARGRGDEAAR